MCSTSATKRSLRLRAQRNSGVAVPSAMRKVSSAAYGNSAYTTRFLDERDHRTDPPWRTWARQDTGDVMALHCGKQGLKQ